MLGFRYIINIYSL